MNVVLDAAGCPLALLLAGGTLLALVWPPAGLAALIAGSLLVPFTLATGTHTELNFTVLFLPLLLSVWGARLAWRRERPRLGLRPIRSLLVFVAVFIVAFAVANQPWLPIAPVAPLRAQVGGLAVVVLSAGAFLLMADQVRDLRSLQFLTVLFLTLGTLYCEERLLPELATVRVPRFQAGGDGSLFWTWYATLAFSQALFNRDLNVPSRLGLGALVFAGFFIVLTQSPDWASGWVPPLVGVGATLWIGAPRMAVLLTAIGAGPAFWKFSRVVALMMSADNRYGLATRLEAWRVLARIGRANPVVGLGPANYYHSTHHFPISGWYVHFSSHNTYVDIVLQGGLLGLACFLWFIWEVTRTAWELLARVPHGFARAYVIGALGGLVGTLAAAMLGDWLLPFVYNVGVQGMRASVLGWIFLGGLIALARMDLPQSR